ncbi:MAG: divalent cation tolerance protein CutA [Bacteroidia bacterium]|nr:divalent cation tolerance protein CutA [Bacteroidia bacterium]
MILIHVLTNDHSQALEISDFLVSQKLIVSAVIIQSAETKTRDANGMIISENQSFVMGKTKALLFNEIDKQLKAKYNSKMPILYSVPIVHMDWDQSEKLVNETTKV